MSSNNICQMCLEDRHLTLALSRSASMAFAPGITAGFAGLVALIRSRSGRLGSLGS